jgi:hypothetical protein
MIEPVELWWKAEKADVHDAIVDYVSTLGNELRDVHERHYRCAWLYNNQPIAQDLTLIGTGLEMTPVTENVIESVIDTATSMTAKQRPRPTFMTDGALWSVQRRAHKLGLFMEAEFHRLGIYDHGVRTFRDGCIFGTGAVKIHRTRGKKGRAVVERVLIDELRVDERECRTGPPRQIHQVKFVDREVLKALHARGRDKADITAMIELANAAEPGNEGVRWNLWQRLERNQVVVIESWHLPSAPGAKDGRHVIALDSGALLDEPWTKDYFPFVFYRWSERLVGFFGRGLAEQLAGIQLRINKLNKFIGKAQDLISVPRIFLDAADAHLKTKFNTEAGRIFLTRSGKPPFVLTPPAVATDIYQYKEQLKRSAYQFAGISELSAQSKKPEGLESAVALREFNDIETSRFAIQAQRLEAWYLEVARQLVAVYKEIAADGGTPVATWKRRRRFDAIEWGDVDLEEDVYSMQIEASSILSRTPAGRLQAVVEMSQAGLIDQDEARRLMNHPDLERSMSLYNAALDDAERLIEKLSDGKFEVPEPFQNLALCIHRVNMAALLAKEDDAPEEVLEGFRSWLDQAVNLVKDAVQPSAPPPGAGPPPNAMVGAPSPGQLPMPLPSAKPMPMPGAGPAM